jgi:2-polyprenyl-3-methyl-5-hydroxy-6-metoxy-1,4-benzoquinol methylase
MSQNAATAVYEHHHAHNRQEGFSILKADRGALFAGWIGTGKRVLDIGCRDGALTRYFAAGNSVVGADVDRQALARAAAELGIETKLVDVVAEWPFDETFDAVVAGEVLEHLYYPDKVSERVSASLRPGGIFVGSVPNAFSLKNRLRYLRGTTRHTPLADPTHINHFSADSLRAMLQKHFAHVEVVGLGRYRTLSRYAPSWVSFDLAFRATR